MGSNCASEQQILDWRLCDYFRTPIGPTEQGLFAMKV